MNKEEFWKWTKDQKLGKKSIKRAKELEELREKALEKGIELPLSYNQIKEIILWD